MAVWGKRESYTMVAVTVTIWIGISALAHIFRPLIPPDENDLLAQRPGAFLKQAKNQQIPWQVMSDSAFTEARRLDRPILLVLGTGFSSLGQKMDRFFGLQEVASIVRQDFVAVRVDLERFPAWKSKFIPLLRNARGDSPWFQMYLLDYEGKIIDAPSHLELWASNDTDFLAILRESQEQYAARSYTRYNTEQSEEEFRLTGGMDAGVPDVEAYVFRLLDSFDPRSENSRPTAKPYLTPQDYLLLHEVGRERELGDVIGPIIQSPAVDLLDGGFFYSARDLSWFSVDYTKVTTLDADMTEFLSRITDGPGVSQWLLERNFDRLVQFVDAQSMPTYIYSESGDFDRSDYFSFAPRRLGRELSADQREWSENVLGLSVDVNPQMSPRLADPERFMVEGEMREAVFKSLRAMQDDRGLESYGRELLPQRAYVMARLLTASLNLDPERRSEALSAFEKLRETMRVGINDVFQERSEAESKPGGFSAYLGYADAALRAYFLTQNEAYLNDGYRVLQRGLYLHESEEGVLSAIDPVQDQSVIPALIPEVTDSEMQSMLGQAVGLLSEYVAAGAAEDPLVQLERVRRYLGSGSVALQDANHGFSGLARAALKFERAQAMVREPDDPS